MWFWEHIYILKKTGIEVGDIMEEILLDLSQTFSPWVPTLHLTEQINARKGTRPRCVYIYIVSCCQMIE